MDKKTELLEQSRKFTFPQRVKLCREYAAVGDHVIVYKLGQPFKRGRIVKLTSNGAYIYNPEYKRDQEYDSEEHAEFYAFSNNITVNNDKKIEGGMVLVINT